VAAAALLCVSCGRIDKLAEPLAQPPVLGWEPLPPPGSAAEMAAEEHEFQKAEQRAAGLSPRDDLEPTGSLPGRNPTVLAEPAPAPKAAAPKPKPKPETKVALNPPAQPVSRASSPAAEKAPAPRPKPEPPSKTASPAPLPNEPPKLALELPPAAPPPAMPTPPEPIAASKTDAPGEITLPLAPASSRAATPQSAPQACPPADRDGVVRCPIFAGWAGAADLDGAPRGPDSRETALILLGTLVAAGIFDILRRLLR